jgi:Gp5 N-terminal OB domain
MSTGDMPIIRFGEVISVQDPYRMFRAQIRVFGLTDDKRGIPDSDLPWYSPMFPVTSPSLAGAGASSGLEVGSKVMVMIMDYPSCQHGFIMGTHYPGPSSPSHISPLAKGLLEKGPELPIGPNGQKMDLGPMGNFNIIDKINNVFSIFKDLLEKSQIFKNLNIFKVKN